MRLFYLINRDKKLVEFGKVSSERGHLLESFLNFKLNKENFTLLQLKTVKIDSVKVENKIKELLNKRESIPSDVPDYKGRFNEEEVFEWKNFKEEKIKLCNTGFDSNIIFLINLYDSALRDEEPHYIVLADNHKQFRDMKV